MRAARRARVRVAMRTPRQVIGFGLTVKWPPRTAPSAPRSWPGAEFDAPGSRPRACIVVRSTAPADQVRDAE